MDKNNLPQNGLPKELMNIPLGQIFLLTNPALGLPHYFGLIISYIRRIAREIGQICIIHELPIDYSDLWDCFACKIKTADGYKILISDRNSLIKMLCEIWDIDIDDFNKTIKGSISIGISTSSNEHPIKVSVSPYGNNYGNTGDESGSMQWIQSTHSKTETLNCIKSSIIDNFSYGLNISLDEIMELYKEVEKNKRTYKLDIKIVKQEVFEKGKPIKKIKECNISIIDDLGTKYPIKMELMPKTIYLTFIALQKRFWIKEISGDVEFYNAFKTIYLQLPNSSLTNLPKDFKGLSMVGTDQYIYFLQKTGKIRDAILNATNSNYLREQFAIEGNVHNPFGVAGATDELSTLIKKEFGIE